MYVRMNKLRYFVAGGALRTGIPVLTRTAIEVLEEGEDNGERSPSIVLMEEHSMGDPPCIHHSTKGGYNGAIAFYVAEPHEFLSPTNSAKSARYDFSLESGRAEREDRAAEINPSTFF